MKKAISILFVFCCLNSLLSHLKAETITYDFSSPEYWVTESNGIISPQVGANFEKIYYKETNDCFVGKNDVYFYGYGGLMLKPKASLKLPSHSNWTINRVIIHSHTSASTSVSVNVFSSHDGVPVSSSLKWETRDSDYSYDIFSLYKKSSLYVMTTNSSNARISSITIEYTSDTSTSISSPTFSPGTSTFSAESLDISIVAAEGGEIYYTTDGTIPSYTNPEKYTGTKGNVVTIYASDSPVELKAIAVNPYTGVCSNVSSAVYTYVSPSDPDEDPQPSEPEKGSSENPYTVSEVEAMIFSIKETDKWVKGTIYGIVGGVSNGVVTSDFNDNTNIVLGDATSYIAVQLPEGSIRDAVNLKDHPYLLGKEILINGDIEAYQGKVGVKSSTEYIISHDVPINKYGYASLFLDMPVSMPIGCTAYYCTTNGKLANLYPIEEIIPANTGVIIESVPSTTCSLTYTTKIGSDAESVMGNNQLIGFTQDTFVAEDDYSYYALNAKDGKVGFYIPQTSMNNSATTTGFIAKANKAYLQVPKGQEAVMFVILREDDNTNILPAIATYGEIVYDLYGRSVLYPTSGIYIKGGKKIVIK